MQEWRNWQTRRLQVPVTARPCGFKSHLLHFLLSEFNNARHCPENPAAISSPGQAPVPVKLFIHSAFAN